ncbi:hypothetical protein KKB55_18320 [Myxococcota bacterium]|nr:hypothetical protein [Myxococcota bacterium]
MGVEGGVNSLPAYIDVPSGETLTLIMSYTPTSTAAPSGVLRFRTNSTAKPEGSIPIEVPDTAPEIAVAPTTVDFERVPARTISELPVTVTNIGQAPLQILRLQVSGSAADPQAADPNGFWVTVGGEDPVLNSSVLVDPDGDGVPGLKNGQSFDIMVHYQTLTDGQDEGFLSIFSNDTIQPEYKVALKANGASPCARVDPNPIEFPASLINRTTSRPVSLESCGGEKLMILDVYLKDGSSDAFTLDENTLPEFPYELPAFDASQDSFYPNRNITLNFHPTQQAPYTGTLVVVTNDPALYADVNTPGEYEIPITGLGTINECPVACVAQEEFNVPPLEIISLDASCSMDLDGPDGKPVKYRWSVIQAPPGSTALPVESFFNLARPADGGLADDEGTPNAFFFVDLAGEYVLELNVVDNLDMIAPSATCSQPAALVHIDARPDSDIHIQLVWDTPDDADQTDQEGTDIDLHLLHPRGTQWQMGPLDCFYANPNPDWGVVGPANNCTLDIDDVNGAGPENINVREPEDTSSLGSPYRIGVHYYSPNMRIGAPDLRSEVTVRVYLGGMLAVEWDRTFSHRDDFWEVGAIIWTAGEQRAQEINRFTPGF